MQQQTSNKLIRKLLISGIFLVLISIIIIPSHNAKALTVSPSRIEINAKPGDKISGQFNVINEQGSDSSFYTSSENFEAQGETGTPNFVKSTDGLASWINLNSEVVLKGGDEKVVAFTINIPKDADPGGHFAAIFLSTTPSSTSNPSVTVGAKIGVLILLHVAGEIKESAGLLGFATDNKQRFFSSLPIAFSYRFNNNGGDRIQPNGNILIKNTFRLISADLQANPSQGNVLPSSVRKFTINWNTDSSVAPNNFWSKVSYEFSHFAFGLYTAKLALTYGVQSTAVDSSFTFFVIPWELLLVIVISLLIIGFILKKGIKRYNQYIINTVAKAQSK